MLTIPRAVVLGAFLIATSLLAGLLAAPLIAPWRGMPVQTGLWEINAVTGQARLCRYDQFSPLVSGSCFWWTYTRLPTADEVFGPDKAQPPTGFRLDTPIEKQR